MSTSSHRRIAEVERYVHELAIALSGLPADEREDVIAGVRGHIDDALVGISDPTPADVQRILDDLGDPLTIASHAGAPTGDTAQPYAAAPDRSTGRTVPLLQRDWVPAAVVVSFVLAGLLVWVAGPAVVTSSAILWLLGVVLLWASPLWRTLEKAVATAVFAAGPAVLFTFGLGFSSRRWIDLVVAIGLAAIVVTSAWLLRGGTSRVPR